MNLSRVFASILAISSGLLVSAGTASFAYPNANTDHKIATSGPSSLTLNTTLTLTTRNVAEAAVYVQGKGSFAKGRAQAQLKAITLPRLASSLLKCSDELSVDHREYLEQIQAGGGFGLFLGFLSVIGGGEYNRETKEMRLDSNQFIKRFGCQGLLDLDDLERETMLEYEFWIQGSGSSFQNHQVRYAINIPIMRVDTGDRTYNLVSTSKDDTRLISKTGGVIDKIKEISKEIDMN